MGRKEKLASPQGNTPHSVGMRLRFARRSKGTSLTELAKALNYSVGYLSGVENGKHDVPEELIRRYEKVLALKPGELSEYVQTPRKIEPVGKPPSWRLPFHRNLFFTGRESLLEDMRKRLWHSGTSPHVLSIVGISGVGKTQLAVEYAYRYRDHYHAVFWLDAHSSEALIASCLELAKYLDSPEKDAQDRRVTISEVQHRLRELPGSLIILDNLEDPAALYTIESPTPLQDFLLQLGEHDVMITTRTHVIGSIVQTIELGEMKTEEGALFLLRRAKFLSPNASAGMPESSLALAQEIVQAMGGLPISLDLAGSYLEETGCGLSSYLHLLTKHREKASNQSDLSFSPYPLNVVEAWSLSIEKVRETHADAVELLHFCTFLGPGKIHEAFLIEAGSFAGSTLHTITADAFKLHQAIGTLRKYSLVRTDAESGALFMHPLVQTAIQHRLDQATCRRWAERAVRIVSQIFPAIRVSIDWKGTWEKCQLYFPQAEACIALAESWNMEGEEVTQLLRKIGKYLQERTQLTDAEKMYQRALSLDKQYYGERHITVATDLSYLAMLYEKKNHEKVAEELYEHALFILQQTGNLESLDPLIVRAYLRFTWKRRQHHQSGEFQQHIKTLQSGQGQRIIKRTLINDSDDRDIHYQKKGDWFYTHRRGTGDFNEDVHTTSTKGASFELAFEGIGIEIISDTLSAQGEIEIYLDDDYIQTVNISRFTHKLTQTIIFSKTDLAFGTHTLRVELVNGTFVLDALAVFSYEDTEQEHAGDLA